MKKKTAVLLGISACVIFTAFQMYTPKPPVPKPFLPKTFCGMLGDHKIEVASEYFGTMPDYEGLTAWSATVLKPNADCSSKFTRLDVHTNLISGNPSEPFGQKPFDVVLTIRAENPKSMRDGRISDISAEMKNKVTYKEIGNNVLETTKNEIGHFKRKIIFFNKGVKSEVLECTVNTGDKMLDCEILFYSEGYSISISGDYESLIDFAKVRIFTDNFIKNVTNIGASQ
jgi:hypothetical protein